MSIYLFRTDLICPYIFVLSTTIACQIFTQFLPALTNPADLSRRYSCHQGVVLHIFRHYRSGRDQRALSDGVAAYHGAVGTQRRTFFY